MGDEVGRVGLAPILPLRDRYSGLATDFRRLLDRYQMLVGDFDRLHRVFRFCLAGLFSQQLALVSAGLAIIGRLLAWSSWWWGLIPFVLFGLLLPLGLLLRALPTTR